MDMTMFGPETDEGVAAKASLAALAEQLRDGPLQELVELQRRATELSYELGESGAERLRHLEELVRLSLSAMEHFHSFTREFQLVLRELTDVSLERH
jgi:DNA-binding PadR family transcriptional regulator